ncbi:MAG: hypothetical protein MZW92_29765 [Comamonadaceae bacterium]|nr:hypothetical protein [Comamonadaceae bacterium]
MTANAFAEDRGALPGRRHGRLRQQAGRPGDPLPTAAALAGANARRRRDALTGARGARAERRRGARLEPYW